MERVGIGKIFGIVLLAVFGMLVSCNVLSSDSSDDKLKEQVIFTSNRSASNNPDTLGRFEGASIHRMNPDGSGVQQITALRSPNESHFEASISPNGEQIAFSVRIAHSNEADEFYIYRSRYDGTEMQFVAGTGSEHIINPRWSPVDNRIAFGSNRYGDYDIFTIKSDGSDRIQITQSDSMDVYPSWSPDGSKIAFTSNRDGSPDLYVRDLEEEQVTQITDHDSTDSFPRWSPDGTKIAFTSNRDGNDTEAYIAQVNGSNLTKLTNNETSDTPFSWSANNEKIAIITYRDGNLEVFKIYVEGKSNPVNLSNNPATDWDPEWGHIKVSGE